MNSFGNSTTQQYPLVDPRSVRFNRARFRRDAIPLLERANSIYIPSGRYSTRGWLLMGRDAYNNISKLSNSLVLNIGDVSTQQQVTLRGLSIVQAHCVTHGISADSNEIYLIEVTDGRGIAHNHWFKSPILKSYNIRSPAYPQAFYQDSTNAGSPWSWNDMLQDMWSVIGGVGSWPGLPNGIQGTPEGFWFPGVPGWYYLNDVIEHVGFNVAADLVSGVFKIVESGASDNTFTSLQNLYSKYLEDDFEWIDVGAARIPLSVVVLFRRRNTYYGSEETVRRDSFQWATNSFYTITKFAPATFAGFTGQGTHYIWDDFTIEYDDNSAPDAGDIAAADLIATERVNRYYNKIYSGFGNMTQIYVGALPFVTGSQVDGVAYYQHYKDQDRQGWKTKIVRGGQPIFPELADRYDF